MNNLGTGFNSVERHEHYVPPDGRTQLKYEVVLLKKKKKKIWTGI